MANKTVAELTAAAALDGTELAHVVQGGNSRKITTDNLSTLAAASAQIAALLPTRFVQGLELSNNATDATNDIDIAAGRARGNGVVATNGSILVKRLDAAWAEGTNQGGLDTGSKANSTTYHVHAIRKDSDGTFDALFSTSATAPTVPSGWTLVERLGAVLTDGSGVIRPFIQTGNLFRYSTLISSLATDLSTTTTRAKAALTVNVPNGIRVKGLFQLFMLTSSGDSQNTATFADGVDTDAEQQFSVYASVNVKSRLEAVEEHTNTSRQISFALDITGTAVGANTLKTLGWTDISVPRI